VETIIGLVFAAILMAGAWGSMCALMPLFARLPFPSWLVLYMNFALGFFNALTVIVSIFDILKHGFQWRKISQEGDSPAMLLVWLITVAACGVACGTYGLLAPRHLPLWGQQLGVGVAGVGFWFLLILWLVRRAEATAARLLAAK
jgi:hypothetical protein